jgi:hypothetical protein
LQNPLLKKRPKTGASGVIKRVSFSVSGINFL